MNFFKLTIATNKDGSCFINSGSIFKTSHRLLEKTVVKKKLKLNLDP